MRKILLLLIIFLPLTIFNLFAQTTSPDGETEEYNRWSASLYGGYVFGERDRGQQIFASRFNVVSDPSWAVGGDVRYALNSFWAIEGGYRYTTLEGVGFETTMHTASVKNSFNLNRFYRRSSLSEYVNPFIILGVEQDFFNAEGPDEEFSRSEASLIGGLGIAFRLSDRVEVFGQHEIKLSSNRLDLTDRGYPYDQIGMASGGVRVHFGSSSNRPKNLKPATRYITDREYEDIFARAAVVDDLTQRVDSLENEMNARNQENRDTFGDLYDRVAALESRVDSLEAKLADCPCGERTEERTEPDEPERELRRYVDAGHYVQVFASQSYEDALRIRGQIRQALSDSLEDPEDQVFIIQRRQFYEVLIGTFVQFSNAQQLLPQAVDQLSDSFVITFPRPVHLQAQYEGTVIVND